MIGYAEVAEEPDSGSRKKLGVSVANFRKLLKKQKLFWSEKHFQTDQLKGYVNKTMVLFQYSDSLEELKEKENRQKSRGHQSDKV